MLYFLRNKKANISLPIIRENNQMDFFEWTNKDPLKINKYGIAEPTLGKKNLSRYNICSFSSL